MGDVVARLQPAGTMIHMKRLLAASATLAFPLRVSADWPQCRGPHLDGTNPATGLAVRRSTTEQRGESSAAIRLAADAAAGATGGLGGWVAWFA